MHLLRAPRRTTARWAALAIVAAASGASAQTPAPEEPLLNKVLKGFYGTFDVSFDATTKGMDGFVAYPYSLNDPNNPNSGYTQGAAKGGGAGPVGRVGWMPQLSTNKSSLGYRGAHGIGSSDVEFVYQIETGLGFTASPGLSVSWTQQSDVVKTAIGYGDTFIGIHPKGFGTLKVGTTYSPYKRATDRLNPFSGQLGDYAAVMGNSGGDNRVEFGTRLDHSLWYESPKIADMVSVDFLWAPGQNRTFDSLVQPAGSPDCAGGNVPGSGNLPLNCDDGAFQDAISADVRVEVAGLYVTGAVEWHDRVNRNSDGIGSNNPYYPYYAATHPNGVIGGPTLDPTVNNPQGLPPQALGGYVNSVGPEYAMKVAAQYVFDFGFSIGAIFEALRRSIPAELGFQNERTRNGTWITASQKFGQGTFSVGWAHATRTPGDPGGQHNYSPYGTDDTANMFTAAIRWQLDKSLTWYADFADTVNNGNAHFDLGAGGRGITTDCHDGTSTAVIDYSGAGPTTWGGCNEIGVSTGLNYKF